jgi:predicted ABC-type sugar transport system permease subunit
VAVTQFVVQPTGIGWPDYSTKIAALAPMVGQTIADWQVAEHNIISIGAAGVSYWVTLCLLNIEAITPASVITLRTYMVVNGVERLLAVDTVTQGVDPDIVWAGPVLLFTIHEVVRITAQSAVAGDNGRAIGYDYQLELR